MPFKNKEKVKEYAKKYREEHKEYFIKKYKEWRERNPSENPRREKLSIEERVLARRDWMRKYKKNNRKKVNARQTVFYAMKCGKIKKLPCEKCGKKRSEAHHKNYSKPLEIEWLCKKHHIEADKMLKKLSPDLLL